MYLHTSLHLHMKHMKQFHFIHKDMVEEISPSGESSANLNDSHETNSNISEDIHDDDVCTRNLCVCISYIYVDYTKMH